jgi:dTDP-4-dehydrorhamnose reductase
MMMNSTRNPRITILGGSGAIGRVISHYLGMRHWQVEALTSETAEIRKDNHLQVCEAVLSRSPDLVLNLAGFTRDRCLNSDPESILSINSIFPQNAARKFASAGVPFVHLSTDCVFNGKAGPYTESSLCDAEEIYGQSKAAGESQNAIVLRGSFLGPGIPPHFQGFLEWILAKKNSKVSGFSNVYWNGITYLTLAEVVEEIHHGRLTEPGVYHLNSMESLSRSALIEVVGRAFNLNIETTEEISQHPIDRRLYSERAPRFQSLTASIESQIFKLASYLREMPK